MVRLLTNHILMKRILLVSFLIFATKTFSQEVLFEKQLPEGFKVKRSFQITNTNNHVCFASIWVNQTVIQH